MPSQIILKVTKGALEGKEFIYDSKEQLFVGRQEDCAIALPDKTVSRYHCMLEVTPPNVTVRDFGSLNGTFLNGEKIGQRDKAVSAEDAQKEYHEEFELHDGDTLGLSRNCEMSLHTVLANRCAECGDELSGTGPKDANCTVLDDMPRVFVNKKGEEICEACHLKLEAQQKEAELAALERDRLEKEKEEAERRQQAKLEQERLERERAEAEAQRRQAEEKAAELAKKLREAADKAANEEAEKQRKEAEEKAAALKKAEEEKQRRIEQQRREEEERRRREEQEKQRLEAERKRLEEQKRQGQKKCANCGASFTPKGEDNNLCPRCVEDRGKVLEAILLQALGGMLEQPKKDIGPAAIKGFRKVKLLGAGGMGEVWLVQEEATGRQYALKTMLPEVAANKAAKETFLREALVSEALDHKNVIKVYKTGCESNVFYILMELCAGGSVDKYMERCGGRLPLDVATYIILQVLDGLEYAHHADVSVKCGWRTREAAGIVHRDFKPGNIFLADSGRYPKAKVADFGLAKAFETAGLSKHTRTGTAAGTPVFQPRQQIENFKYSKPDVDVWAAAASFYNMLTGNIPKDIRGNDIWMAMYTGQVVPVRQRDSRIPEALAAVIDRALVERPEIGIKTAKEFKRQLVGALPPDVKNAVKGVL